jgi:glutathione S-transferase
VVPDPSLTPRDPKSAARMDQAMNVNDWYLFQNCGAVIAFQRVVGPKLLGITSDEAAIAAAMPRAETVFAELSRLLGDQVCFAGEDVSLADMMIGPQLDFLAMTPEWDTLVADRKNLASWLERMRQRPSFQTTTWEKVAQKAAA